jgi:glutathione S-transferase
LYSRYAPEKIPYGIKRYQEETARLYSVLEDGLNAGKGEWLVGDKYSIADINGGSPQHKLQYLTKLDSLHLLLPPFPSSSCLPFLSCLAR